MIYLAKYNRGRKSKALQEATDLTHGGAFADIVAPPRKEVGLVKPVKKLWP